MFADVDVVGLGRPPTACLDVVIGCASQCECSSSGEKGVTSDISAEAGLEEMYNP